MTRNRNPHWKWLTGIGLVSGAALMVELGLPFSPALDAWFLVGWTLVFYGFMGAWIARNSNALEQQPTPRDCVGRPITQSSIDEPHESGKRLKRPIVHASPRPLRHTEIG